MGISIQEGSGEGCHANPKLQAGTPVANAPGSPKRSEGGVLPLPKLCCQQNPPILSSLEKSPWQFFPYGRKCEGTAGMRRTCDLKRWNEKGGLCRLRGVRQGKSAKITSRVNSLLERG